jgi:glycine dehydrogenase subunit 1
VFDVVAVVFPQPNVFGVLTDVDALTDVANDHNLLVIGVVNPIVMSSVKEPGSWGTRGADIVCGEGQPLGIPLSLGGPYFGFLCTRLSYVRQLPGRIVGETVDSEGQTGYVLTLQAREQHIRRAKATSNICTNQGLMVTMATIYLHAMGPSGLQQVALESYERGHELSDYLCGVPGVGGLWDRPFWHERVLSFDRPVEAVCSALQAEGFFPGVALGAWYPELSHCLLVCATETKTASDILALMTAMTMTMAELEEGVDAHTR